MALFHSTIILYGTLMKNNNKISFKSLFTEKAINLTNNKEIRWSSKIDGIQVVHQYVAIVTIKQTG